MSNNAIDFMQFTDVESRITTRLIKYWKSLKGINKVPLEKNIDTNRMYNLWDNCFILRVSEINEEGNYRYDYLGKNICDSYAKDLYNSNFSNLGIIMNVKAYDLHDKYINLINKKRPIEHQGVYVTNEDQILKFRQCMVPFSSDGKNVTTIIGAMNYKIIKRS